MTVKQILLMIPPGAELLETAVFTDVFGWDMLAGSKSCRLVSAGINKTQATAFHQSFCPQLLLKDTDPADFAALALPGGFPRYGYFDAEHDPDFLRIAEHFIRQDKPLAAVCTGVLLLARCGLLRGRTATIYPGENGRWQEQLRQEGVLLAKEKLCQDASLISADGPASAHLAALRLLELLTDGNNARHTAEMIGWPDYSKGDNYERTDY